MLHINSVHCLPNIIEIRQHLLHYSHMKNVWAFLRHGVEYTVTILLILHNVVTMGETLQRKIFIVGLQGQTICCSVR